MALSNDQIEYLNFLGRTASIDSLVDLKKGNIKGIKDFDTKKIDPALIAEHAEMKEILKRWINKRQRQQ